MAGPGLYWASGFGVAGGLDPQPWAMGAFEGCGTDGLGLGAEFTGEADPPPIFPALLVNVRGVGSSDWNNLFRLVPRQPSV